MVDVGLFDAAAVVGGDVEVVEDVDVGVGCESFVEQVHCVFFCLVSYVGGFGVHVGVL